MFPALQTVENSWPSEWRNDIHWIGKHRNEEIAVVHHAYGNGTTPEWHYSTAAISESSRQRFETATGSHGRRTGPVKELPSHTAAAVMADEVLNTPTGR